MINKFKPAIVIQGDFRKETSKVLDFYIRRFDNVIFSTWESSNIINFKKYKNYKNLIIIRNKMPNNKGNNNRFLQRISTYKGIEYAKKIGCSHVLKNRSDMIIMNFRPILWAKLLQFTKKKIITTPYRCATAMPDFLSSMCDYFHFGEIQVMSDLWRVENLNFEGDFCLPDNLTSQELDLFKDQLNPIFYCAESELYALFKNSETCKKSNLNNHIKIMRKLFLLIPINLFGIIWFDDFGKFRKLIPASEHPWWSIFNYFLKPTTFYPNYKYKAFLNLSIRQNLSKLLYMIDLCIQRFLRNFI